MKKDNDKHETAMSAPNSGSVSIVRSTLRVGDLKKVIEALPDDAKVLIYQHDEDIHVESIKATAVKTKWGLLLS